MKTIAILALLCGGLRAADDKDLVTAAANKLADAGSYTFKGETKVESAFGGAGGQQIPPFEGKYEKEAGAHVTVGDRGEYFRKGEKVFVKNQQQDWTELDKAQLPGAGGGQNRQRGAMAGRLMLKNMKTPHEEVKDLPKAFKEIKKEEKSEKVGEKECAVYGGDLSEEGIKASPLGRMIGQLGALGGGAANAEMSGQGRLWIDPDGNLVKFELTSRVAIEFQGNPIEFSMIRSSEISAVGKTKVEVPEGVKKLLEKPAEKSEDKKEQ
ncbi:MAG TPA: hypothetical protein VJB14_04950 [Planctomycetota bacterium]|nr:hypothetical protein [Planctomycetota bacterium]